jgi:hypothetical protein
VISVALATATLITTLAAVTVGLAGTGVLEITATSTAMVVGLCAITEGITVVLLPRMTVESRARGVFGVTALAIAIAVVVAVAAIVTIVTIVLAELAVSAAVIVPVVTEVVLAAT